MSVIYTQGGGASVPDATTAISGKVRLATIQEAQGNSEAIAVTPAGVQAAIAGIVGGMTYKGPYDVAIASPDISQGEKGDFYIITNVKVNPTDTNTTFTRYGQEWAVGDHLIINEDIAGNLIDSKIDKVDNSESITRLNDLLDVTESLAQAGHVLIHDGVDYKNRSLTTADIVGLAQHLYALLDVSLNELVSASYTTSTAALNVVHSRDYTIDIQGYADPTTTPPTPHVKTINLPASLNDAHDEIRIVNIGQGALLLEVQGSAVFYDPTDPLLHNTTPVQVDAGREVNLTGEVRTYSVPVTLPDGSTGTQQVNKVTWYVSQGAVPSRMSLVRTGSADWTNGFLTAADVVGVVTQGEREALQQELDRTQAGAGLNSDGTLTVFSGNYINANTTLRQAIISLDTALKAEETARINTDNSLQSQITQEISDRVAGDAGLQSQITQEINDRSAGDNALQSELDATQAGAGLDAGGAYIANTAASYINTATSLMEADEKLDDAIALLSGTQVVSVNSETPDTNGNVALDGTHIDTTTTEDNYTAVDAKIDSHLDGIDTKLGEHQTELDDTQAGAGLEADGTYSANASTNYIGSATSLKNADELLDTEIQAVQDELDSTQTGAGLEADGAYSANASTNYLGSATSLKSADELLDAQIASLSSTIVISVNSESPDVNGNVALDDTHIDTTTTASNYTVVDAKVASHLDGIDTKLGEIQTELDSTQTGAGLEADGAYSANASTNYLGSATSLKSADELLDTEIKAVQDELDATQTGAGLGAGGAYTANASSNYLGSATSLQNADDLLDAQIAAINASQVNTVNSESPDVNGNVLLDDTHIDTTTTANNYTVVDAKVASHLDGIDDKLGSLQTDLTQEVSDRTAGDANLQSQINSLATIATTGASADASVAHTAVNYTASTQDAEAHLVGIDTALATHTGVNYTGATTDSISTHLGGIDTAIGLKAPIDSPTFTTAANAPTPTAGDSSTSIATTAFVATELANLTTTAQGTAGTMQTSDGSGGFASSQWEVDTTNGHFLPKSNDTYDIGEAENKVRHLYLGSNSLKFADDATTPNVISVGLTDAAHAHGENHVQTSDGVVAICNSDLDDQNNPIVTDPTLAVVAHTGKYTDLIDAPQSVIQTASFDTTVATYNLVAGQHHTYFPPTSGTMTLVLPDSVTGAGGDAIRVTNWGNGDLKITTSGNSVNTWIQYGQTLSQAQTGGNPQPEFIVESRCTVDLYGWSYSSGGTTYDPAWGVYFSPSIEINTKSLQTSGQMLVYDATNDELVAGGLGDLSLTFAPANYDNTLGGTVTGDTVAEHLEGIDNKFADISIDELTDVDTTVASATAGQMLLHDGVNFKPVTHDLDSLTDVDTTTTAPATDDLLRFNGANFVPATLDLDDLTDVDLTSTAPNSGEFLKYDGANWVSSVATATVASIDDIVDVDTSTTTPSDGEVLTWVQANTQWENKAPTGVKPAVDSTQTTTQTLPTPTGAEEVYMFTPIGAITVTLPAPTGHSGFKYQIKNMSTHTITIDAGVGINIDANQTFALSAQYSSVTLITDGSNWFII
jgi:hypothetical protein